MKSIEILPLSGIRQERSWQRYIIDTLLATASALFVTGGIFVFQLYPRIPNVSLIYLLIVLAMAIIRSRYAAIVTSIVAFISFDFFLVSPLYTLTITKSEEWLALFIFLVTAIIAGQLASALRQQARQAMQQERETRALYDLLSATTREEHLDRQLSIVAHAIIENFSFAGVRDCAIFLPDTRGKLILQTDTGLSGAETTLSSDEEKTALLAMAQGKVVNFYDGSARDEPSTLYWFRRAMTAGHPGRRYVQMIPLQMGQRVVGVVRLLVEDNPRHFTVERTTETGQEHLNPHTTFFWTFLDQATAVIERTRLHRESLQVELLQRTDTLRSALLSSVSHDLRTPLASIKAAASSLLQEDIHWDEEAQRSFALAIEREADRLNRLVGNLLDMSRIEGGALKPEKEWYPIDELLHDVLGHMQVLLQGREVRTSIPDNLPPVELDYLQMDQVLTNLLENAIRYTPPGSPIEIGVQVADGEILVSIADRGPGIPSGDLERIFDKFYRVLLQYPATN